MAAATWWLAGLAGAGAVGLVAAALSPNLIDCRKSGNETAGIGALKTIGTSLAVARERAGAPPVVGTSPPENAFLPAAGADAVSTFSIDVDTAAFANVRHHLNHHSWPPRHAVRIEELINYFRYDDPPPGDGRPFAVRAELADCPWAAGRRLLRIGLRGRDLAAGLRPATNLVFLVDVSGSMGAPGRLPLVKRALHLLSEQLDERDRVAIVVYAGAAGLALPPTSGDRRGEVQAALARLEAGGSTHGGAGIQLAYQLAVEGFIAGGVNRVILCTDGDWNVGIRDRGELEAFIARQARSGVALTALGFGLGHGDHTLEALADRGDGQYAYIDGEAEARRVLVEELVGTLVTIARNVKVQVRFDPARVARYRLIGYEDRLLAAADFRDDGRDAGDVGAGHSVTALYELEPVAGAAEGPPATVELRYLPLEGGPGESLTVPVPSSCAELDAASRDLRLAAAAAAFGLLLRDSPHRGRCSWELARDLARGAAGDDPRRLELVRLIERAAELAAERGAGAREPAVPGSLAELGDAQLVDQVLASGTKQGYVYDLYVAPDGSGRWMAVANPAVPGTTGHRWFVTNHEGVVYYSTSGPFQLDPGCRIPDHALPVGK